MIEPQTLQWFEENRVRYRSKSDLFESIDAFVSFVGESMRYRRRKPRVRTFIVHGHDNEAKLELKNYLQNTLDLSEPVILHEKSSRGRTVIEKFEEAAQDVNL